jgi:predicted metal-dependent phosphoesterase TrpH
LDPERVIVGEEIMTTKGELLALFVQEEVPKGLPPLEAIQRLRQQDAFISVSHPFDAVRNGAWALEDLLEIAPLVDAIETFNSRCAGPRPNQQALAFAAEHHLAGTVGSDAHTLWEVGRATLLVEPFKDAAQLRISIRQAEARLLPSPYWVHFASTYARISKKLKINPPPAASRAQ